jgi:uncharacterized protein with PIN domain
MPHHHAERHSLVRRLEVVRRFDLFRSITPFRRCLRCNHLLEPVAKDAIANRLLPLTRQYYEEFYRCPACDRIYWKGSHYERMRRFVGEILTQDPADAGNTAPRPERS